MLLLKYLRGSVIVDKVTEVSKDLTLFGFKNEVFNAIIDGLQRKEMHAFLKFFRPGQIEQRCEDNDIWSEPRRVVDNSIFTQQSRATAASSKPWSRRTFQGRGRVWDREALRA